MKKKGFTRFLSGTSAHYLKASEAVEEKNRFSPRAVITEGKFLISFNYSNVLSLNSGCSLFF